MTDLTLEREIRAVLAQLELLPWGGITAYNPSGGHSGEPDDRMVSEVAAVDRDVAPCVHFRAEFKAAENDERRRQLLNKAKEVLESWSHRPAVPVASTWSERDILHEHIRAAHGFPAQEVATRYATSVSIVKQVRLEDGRDPLLGHPMVLSGSDRQVLVAALSAKGLSQVEVARRLGVTKQAVHQALQRLKFVRADREMAA